MTLKSWPAPSFAILAGSLSFAIAARNWPDALYLEPFRKLVAPTSGSAVLWVSRPTGYVWRRGRRQYRRSGDQRYIPFSIYG